MTFKFSPLWRSLIVLHVLLASCTTATAEPATTEVPTVAQVPATETLSLLPTFTSLPPLTATYLAAQLSATPPPATSIPPTQTSLPDVLPKFPLDGYVMLFSKDGDLYFQDGENAPVKLAHIGEKDPSLPAYISLLSDDNKKVVFIRWDDSNIYSINTDGTQENIVVSNDKMNSFGLELKIGALRFVPNTHQLFFVAIQCKAQDNSPCPTSAFLANTDTGKITKLADLGLLLANSNYSEGGLGVLFANPYIGEYRNIKISPNGKMLAVSAPDGMSIFTLDGNLIRDNVLPFNPNTESIVYPSLFWLPDSSGLIAALPDTTHYTPGLGYIPAHTVWRYTIGGDVIAKIPLDPPPWAFTFDVSSDGNWIAYGGYSDPTFYLGDLTNGHTQIFGEDRNDHAFFSWSPGGKYLINHALTIVISFDKPRVVIEGHGARWFDSNHFISYQERWLIGEITTGELNYYDLRLANSIVTVIKPK